MIKKLEDNKKLIFAGLMCLGALVLLFLDIVFLKFMLRQEYTSIGNFLLMFPLRLIGFLLLNFLALFPITYFVLAPRNLFFTFVKEGEAKMVMRGGTFRKAIIQWKGHKLDSNENVIEGTNRHLFGGLQFYGLWPLDNIYRYKFEWTSLTPDGSPLHHVPEILDYILLKQDVYFGEVKEAEDKEMFPLNVGFVLTLETVNPYKALFNVQNWIEAVISKTIPMVRNAMTRDKYENLIANTEDLNNGIGKNLDDSGLKKFFLEFYGVNVIAIQIQTIDPPEEYREATLKQFVAEQDAKRIVTLATADAEAYEIKKNALGGGKEGLDNLVALELADKIKTGDKIVVEGLRGLLTSGIFSKKP